jgi:hypothetical protein
VRQRGLGGLARAGLQMVDTFRGSSTPMEAKGVAKSPTDHDVFEPDSADIGAARTGSCCNRVFRDSAARRHGHVLVIDGRGVSQSPAGEFQSLFDGVADVVERGADPSAQGAGAANDSDRDQRGDQSVFDGGCPGLVFHKPLHKRQHAEDLSN